MKKAGIIIFIVLVIDQALKIWVKTHMHLGQEIIVFDHWFLLHFTENEGMAFGLSLGGSWGKLLLSLIRVVAITVIGLYLYRLTSGNCVETRKMMLLK